MTVRSVDSKDEWESFLKEVAPHSFLTSWNWGEVQKALGSTIFRFGVYDGDSLVAVALVLHVTARRGAFLFVPHGPVVKTETSIQFILPVLLQALKEQALRLNCVFVRCSPLLEANDANRKIFADLGFRNAPVHLMHPELAWLLDVREGKETLFRNMRKTTRYLIRKAEKEGVTVRQGDSDKDLADFLAVYRKTVDRQNFTPFRDEFFKHELDIFRKDGQVKIFLAEHQGKTIAAAMIVFYGQSAFYHHGASDETYSHIPGSYLLQWRVIEEAQARGLAFYNFWGIVRKEEKKHPWAGLSLFKTGFGGFEEEYQHAQDFVLTPRYWLVYGIEKMRRIRRGL